MTVKKDLSKLDLERGYNVLKVVIDRYRCINQIEYKTSYSAPNNYQEMLSSYKELGYFEVYRGGDHGHLGEIYNTKFRAVHDYMHIKHNLTFKYEDEKKLSDITILEFRTIAQELGFRYEVRKILGAIINAEIRGQIEFYEINKEYVPDQKTFINDYLKVG